MNNLRMHLRLALLLSPKDKPTPPDQEIVPIKEPEPKKVKHKLPSKPTKKIPKRV